jgi:hypothetical protein
VPGPATRLAETSRACPGHAPSIGPLPNSFYGAWSRPTVLDSSVVVRQSASTRGHTLSASYKAVGQGSTLVDASFDQTCAPRDQTPCTIPPQLGFLLQVTVISRS